MYPWDIRLLLDNGLHYQPRPVCQSYSAYTPYLENLNLDHYNSPKAPEFVLYEYLTTDDRYPLFDEPKVNLALSRNYFIEEQFDFDGRTFLLLHKKKDFKPLSFEKIRVDEMDITDRLVPQEGLYYEIYVMHSLAGSLVSVVDHAPKINLKVKVADENTKTFRTSVPLLQSGIFGDTFEGDTKEAAAFFQSLPNSKQVTYYGFKPLKAALFDNQIKVTVYRIK